MHWLKCIQWLDVTTFGRLIIYGRTKRPRHSIGVDFNILGVHFEIGAVSNVTKVLLFRKRDIYTISTLSTISGSLYIKGVRALRGYFGPPMRSKIKVAVHKFLLISLLEQ